MANNTLEITLPDSRTVVVITMPTWGLSREVRRYAGQQKLDDIDAAVYMIVRTSTFDGVTLPPDFKSLSHLSIRDMGYLMGRYEEWITELPEEELKNDSPAGPISQTEAVSPA